jgi:hypothetical protein
MDKCCGSCDCGSKKPQKSKEIQKQGTRKFLVKTDNGFRYLYFTDDKKFVKCVAYFPIHFLEKLTIHTPAIMKAVAKCMPGDTFDLAKGMQISREKIACKIANMITKEAHRSLMELEDKMGVELIAVDGGLSCNDGDPK